MIKPENNMPFISINLSDAFSCFLSPKNRNRSIDYPGDRNASIKDIIESLGVPHTEIGRISLPLQNRDVDFTFIPKNRDVIKVYPVDVPFDVTTPSLLRPEPLSRVSFFVDLNVGKLALLLRILGIDTESCPDIDDKEIALKVEKEKRILLSKDIGLLKRKNIIFGKHVRAIFPDDQLKEVLDHFGLKGPFDLFSLCLLCNRKTLKVNKEDIIDRLEPLTIKYFNHFKICPRCERIYWQGSHHEEMQKRLSRIGISTTASSVNHAINNG
jgi:uncharacterized protein with PIN domain